LTVHAEISIIPISGQGDPSMSKEVAAAFEAIRGVKGVSATLTALGTQIEAQSINDVVDAIRQAHEAAKRAGAVRVISSIRIDERLDKNQTLQDKIHSVERRLGDRTIEGRLDF
jgi:uncharacterized protein (TIGR00106 family)